MWDPRAVQVSTVDAFQGGERDVIIVTTSRTTRSLGGFIDDPRRMNVMLTRAKYHLLVVGRVDALTGDSNWRHVVETARGLRQGVLHSTDVLRGSSWTQVLAGADPLAEAAREAALVRQEVLGTDAECGAAVARKTQLELQEEMLEFEMLQAVADE